MYARERLVITQKHRSDPKLGILYLYTNTQYVLSLEGFGVASFAPQNYPFLLMKYVCSTSSIG